MYLLITLLQRYKEKIQNDNPSKKIRLKDKEDKERKKKEIRE